MTATTYVLIHGGRTTGGFWDRLVPLLDGRVVAPDLPGRGQRPADPATITLDDQVAAVVADVGAAAPEGPLVVVAHSSGGLVVPGVVVALAGRVAHIVLNAASVPPEGGSGLDCMPPHHREAIEHALDHALRTGTPISPGGTPPSPEALRTAFGGDPLDDATLAFVTDPIRLINDESRTPFIAPVHWSQIADVPTTYVVNERDRPVPLALQVAMVTRLPRPPHVLRLDTGHLPMITDPQRFAAIVRQAVSTSAA